MISCQLTSTSYCLLRHPSMILLNNIVAVIALLYTGCRLPVGNKHIVTNQCIMSAFTQPS